MKYYSLGEGIQKGMTNTLQYFNVVCLDISDRNNLTEFSKHGFVKQVKLTEITFRTEAHITERVSCYSIDMMREW